MNTTEPIRSIEKIAEMKEVLGNDRNRMLFTIGINSGLRISDIIGLTVDDIKEVITIKEKKTGKIKQFRLNADVFQQVKEYASHCKHFLFPSRKGGNPISTTQAWRIISKAAATCDLEHIGTHSMRKSFGYHAYRMGVPIAYLMAAFNHSSEAITMRYIGIVQDELNDRVYTQMAL